MHHVVVERWSRGSSFLHARDARAKLGIVFVFLIAVSTTPVRQHLAYAGYAALLLAAVAAARLPVASVVWLALRSTVKRVIGRGFRLSKS